jgi:hypothetical protein
MVVILVVVVGVISSWVVALSPAKKDVLHCEEVPFNAGEITQQAVVSHSFRLENTSPNPVQIVRVEKSCSCTEFQLDRSIIPSGEFASLEMVLRSESKRGSVESSLFVLYQQEGLALKSLPVRINAKVIPHFETSVESIVLSSANRSGRFEIRTLSEPELLSCKVVSSNPAILVKSSEISGKLGAWVVDVSIDPELWLPTLVDGAIRIETDSPYESVRTFPVRFNF